MKLDLLTYDSIVAHNAGYADSNYIFRFSKILVDLMEEFSAATGVKKEEILWHKVTESDNKKHCLIVYAKVEPNWKPTPTTDVWDEIRNRKIHPDWVKPFWAWMAGRGNGVDIKTSPPKNPHSLFHSKSKTL